MRPGCVSLDLLKSHSRCCCKVWAPRSLMSAGRDVACCERHSDGVISTVRGVRVPYLLCEEACCQADVRQAAARVPQACLVCTGWTLCSLLWDVPRGHLTPPVPLASASVRELSPHEVFTPLSPSGTRLERVRRSSRRLPAHAEFVLHGTHETCERLEVPQTRTHTPRTGTGVERMHLLVCTR